MDFSETTIVNPDISHGSKKRSPAKRRSALSGSSIALLICPLLMLAAGLVLIGHMVPIHAGLNRLDYDPAYQYLFNGAALMKGYGPDHIDHPGTPVQLVMGLISVVSWSMATLGGLTSLPFPQSVATNPEAYLGVIMTAFLVMNCLMVWLLGLAVARSSRLMAAGIACQSGYFLLGVLFPRIFHAAPEAMLFLAAAALMAVLAPVIFGQQECCDRRAVIAGLFIGLGTASKVTFFPFFLIVLVLRRRRPICIALMSGVLFFFVFILPIIDRLKSVFGWLRAVATHQGNYGSGAAGFIDWSMIPERAGLIASAEPMLVVAAIALAAVMLFATPFDRWTAAVMAAAMAALTFLTLKHFAVHYVMPAVVIAPAVIVWAISRFTSRQAPYWVAATLALVFGAASIQNTATAFADERALREQNGKAIDEVVARYQNPVVIGAYRAGYQSWAVQFGLGSVGRKFAKSIPGATADDKLGYFAPLDKLLRHYIDAVEWSYLDQFERAGRPILVVLPRGTRIDPQTVQTETLLDQGFGDIVARIIVTPPRPAK